jgi:hypothetical protein
MLEAAWCYTHLAMSMSKANASTRPLYPIRNPWLFTGASMRALTIQLETCPTRCHTSGCVEGISMKHSKYICRTLRLPATNSTRSYVKTALRIFETQPYLKTRLAPTLFLASKVTTQAETRTMTDTKALEERALGLLEPSNSGYERVGNLQEAFDRMVPLHAQ